MPHLILLLPVLAGCTSMSEAGRAELKRARDLYTHHETAEALDALDSVIRDYGRTAEAAEAYYLRGLCRVRRGEFDAAVGDFNLAINKSDRRELTARARASLAAIHYRRSEWERAASLYADAVNDLPKEPPTDQIRYYAGVAMQRAGRWDEAARQFAMILHEFGNRPIANEARRMSRWGHDYFAIQLGAFGTSANAEKVAAAFRSRNLGDVKVEYMPRDSQSMWIVLTGAYKTHTEAVSALTGVRRYQSDAYIVPSP